MELTLDIAQAMVAQALDTAKTDFNRPVCVSVCDTAGFLMAFSRIEGGHMRSIDICQAKAYTAARMGVDTDTFLTRLQREQLSISYFCDPKMTALPGGVTLRDGEGKVLGGIGVAGLSAEDDAAVARLAATLLGGEKS